MNSRYKVHAVHHPITAGPGIFDAGASSMIPRSRYDMDRPVVLYTLLGVAIGLFVWISLHLL